MFPEWHHAVPESAYFKVPETLKTFRLYSISRFVYVLHWLATRLVCIAGYCLKYSFKALAYYALVRSRLEYCCAIGDPHQVGEINRIEGSSATPRESCAASIGADLG